MIDQDIDVHVYDVPDAPGHSDSLGRILIQGGIDPTAAFLPRVRVYIGDLGIVTLDQLFAAPDQSSGPTFRRIGGFDVVQIADPPGMTLLPLLPRTALHATAGRIDGVVNAGRIARLEAQSIAGDISSGVIDATIEAFTGGGTLPVAPFAAENWSIGYVVADRTIAGTIKTLGTRNPDGTPVWDPNVPYDSTNWGSIITVAAGSVVGGDGVVADIYAEYGEIGQVVSGSKIGSPVDPVEIRSGFGVGRISIRDDITSTVLSEVKTGDISAHIDASVRDILPQFGSALAVIETDGNFNGSLNAIAWSY